jgi:2-oxoglutarate dehydrogenase E2 component (dihydrolipoamide succinyltransferase)
MPVDVRIPALGESIQEAVIANWRVEDGASVKADQPLLELETDKATVEITAERAGTLRILKRDGETVHVGEIVARIEEGREAHAASPAPALAVVPAPQPPPRPAVRAEPVSLGPAARRLATMLGIDPLEIRASGPGGRPSQADVRAQAEVARAAPAAERREPMSRIRQRIAERLVQAQQTAAILTTFNEVDLSAVLDWRARHKERFREKHGVSLGFVTFFARACVEALRDLPIVNARIEETDIVYSEHVNLGIAVATERGLVVPVIRQADQRSFPEIEQEIDRLARLAREGKLAPDDLAGGTFSLSNGGVFGSLLSTPILNPPQSAILGMHKIEKRPVVVSDQIVIRPMMYVALSYDHRLVDGEQAVTFLVRVKERLEDPGRLLLEI